jgi:predicted nucleic acid-binding protein
MPSAERPVVADATPIIALAGLGRLTHFRDLYTEIVVPQAVWRELERGELRPGGLADLAGAPWIQTRPLRDPVPSGLAEGLHRGEAEVLALAQEVHARLVVMDDRLGRRHAAVLGLRVTGTVGVLLAAKRKGLEPRIGPLLDQLDARGLYLSQKLRALALERAGER